MKASVFWGFTRYGAHRLEKDKTISKEYYASLLEQLDGEIKGKHSYSAKKKELFHHNNAFAQTSAIVLPKLHYKLMPDAPYLPDFISTDFFCFRV